MKKTSFLYLMLISTILSVLVNCSQTEDLVDFTEDEELLLGERLADFISRSDAFEVLPPDGDPPYYQYAGDLLQNIVATDLLSKSEVFVWSIRILEDETRQAFVLPGGHVYVSSGMINFLDNEDQFSGLLAHLVSHANYSHAVEILVFKYGINGLKRIAAGGSDDQLDAIVSDLDARGSLLSYTNGMEQQADSLAVRLLGRIDQSCEGAALAFEKMLRVQPDQQVGMISKYQITESKLQRIQSIAASEGCDLTVDDTSRSRYTAFRNSLP